MNKYKVKVVHMFYEILDIEAENEESARNLALDIVQQDTFNSKPQYENTIPAEHWAVISEEEYNKMLKDFEAKLAEQQKESSNIITP